MVVTTMTTTTTASSTESGPGISWICQGVLQELERLFHANGPVQMQLVYLSPKPHVAMADHVVLTSTVQIRLQAPINTGYK